MKDYTFLIIAVVISIFAALKKNKKKENIDNFPGEIAEKSRNYFMDQLLGKDFLDDDDDHQVQSPVRIHQSMIKEPLVSPAPLRVSGKYQTTFKSTLPDRFGKSIQSTLKKTDEPQMDANLETADSPGYLEDFSLRKAFVYSEIMNPKYIQTS
jgi:hypothetical protein